MWQEQNHQLYRKFEFENFKTAFEFMNKVAEVADKMNHHPTWNNSYNVVEIWLSTHTQGKITDKDFELADAIDMLIKTSNAKERNMADSASVDKKTTDLTDVKLYTDGGSRGNPGPSAAAYVIITDKDDVVEKFGHYIGITTNNQAEYQALRHGLERVLKFNPKSVQVFMDSLLVINQINGLYKVKNRDLWPIYESINQLKSKFRKITFHHVPREFNKLADAEVNRILDEQ